MLGKVLEPLYEGRYVEGGSSEGCEYEIWP